MPGAGSSDISRLRQFGNFWLNKIVNLLYGTRYTDLCYGYNAFRRECLSVMDLEAGAPDGTDERTHAVGRRVRSRDADQCAHRQGAACGCPRCRASTDRRFGASNLNAFSDGLRVFRTIHIERKRGARRNASPSKSAESGGWRFVVGDLHPGRRGQLTTPDAMPDA